MKVKNAPLLKIGLILFLIMGIMTISGCAKVVKKGSKIKVDYVGKLENGSVFDQSKPDTPLAFTVGSGQLIPGFDNAVVGMKLNQEKKITLKPEEAYGLRNETLIREFPKKNLPKDFKAEKGAMLQLKDQSGRAIPGIIVDITKDAIKVDLNHPLAGKTLVFDIKVVGIE